MELLMRHRLLIVIASSLLAAALCAAAGTPSLHAQTAADSAAIRATALDYAEGWYGGDAARMERALHPQLAKRIVRRSGDAFNLQEMTATQLVDATRGGGGRSTPSGRQRKDVQILDVFGNTASVRLSMDGWIDYMHMAKWQGRWVIVNVLWETRS
jgi:hypothetical protein